VSVTADHDEEELLGLVPGSFKQAMEIAEDHIFEHPYEEVVIKRGEQLLHRIGPNHQQKTVA
jgi:hypothetical protein